MNRVTLFNSPLLLGFDHFERLHDRVAKSAHDGYPPHNIEAIGEHGLRITLAVAGFAREDLHITLEDNQIVIRGQQAEEAGKVYLHRGIAARQFQRNFVLAEGIVVTGATLDSGLLSIDLARPQHNPVSRTIEIRNGELTQPQTAAKRTPPGESR
ncbi:MAG: Hsp20 family protein [Alphaproteobacteria bacterium]|nr:Hsp20 family protein [Alphaproteobacteria bacterium]